MNRAYRISVAFIVAVLVLTGWLNLGALLLSVLFSYFVISKFDFMKPRGKWIAVVLFLVVIAALAYGSAYLIQASVSALPAIAETAVPHIVQWAAEKHIVLPFTDLEGLKSHAIDLVRAEASDIGKFADFARGATTQFIYLTVGCIVAIGIFLNPALDIDRPSDPSQHTFYSLCCVEISRRFDLFYESFAITMNAQVTISAINTALTGIFMVIAGLPHLAVALGISFIAGIIPVVGNIIGSLVLVAIGFVVSPGKGLAALIFMVCLHHLGFFVSSKIIGDKIRTSFWLTLVALVVGEGLMGVTGMVLAPVLLHYIRIEASRLPVNSKTA